jgi:hypothetical protein
MNTRLLATTLVVLASATGCPKGGMPGVPAKPGSLDRVPTGMPSGEVDPNTCGNYAAIDAGRKFKVFLQATKDLETTAAETVKVVKQSCVMMGQELGMSPADLNGETDDVCARVITTYQNNLKVTLKPGARLTVKYKPATCTADAQLRAKAAAECQGGATAGTGGNSAGGQCQAAAGIQASLAVQCTPPELTLAADAKLVVDPSKLERTLQALRNGLPKLLSVQARLQPLQAAVADWTRSVAELKDMGPKFAQSFADQAVCISGQVAAVINAATHIQANVSVSVKVTASASATASGG